MPGPAVFTDIDERLFTPQDTVVVAQRIDDSPPIGVTGTWRGEGAPRTHRMVIYFDDPRYNTWNTYEKALRITSLPEIKPDTPPEDVAKLLSAGTSWAIIGGSVFQLVTGVAPDATALLKRRDEAIAQRVAIYQARLRAKEVELAQQIAQLHSIPPFTAENIFKHKIQVYPEGENALYVIPIVYAPQYIWLGGERYLLSESHRAELRHNDLRLRVWVNKRAEVHGLGLCDANGTHFPHYHGQSTTDCVGHAFQLGKVAAPRDIVTLRDKTQRLFETINGDSLANLTPPGLPSYRAIFPAATKVDAVPPDVWVTSPDVAAPPVGSYVKILRGPDGVCSSAEELIGLIGKVLVVQPDYRTRDTYFDPTEGRLRVGVEFCFRRPYMHNLDGATDGRRGLWFALQEVEKSDATRCTRPRDEAPTEVTTTHTPTTIPVNFAIADTTATTGGRWVV